MAIKTENIIYNIITQKNGLADALDVTAVKLDSLEKEIKFTSENAQAAFEVMKRTAKNYAEQLGAATARQKELTASIREQEKITQEFRTELTRVEQKLKSGVGQNTVQFQRLTKEANRLRDAIKDNNTALQGFRIEKRTVDDSIRNIKELQKVNNDFTRQFIKDQKEVASSTEPPQKGITKVKDTIKDLAKQAAETSGPVGKVIEVISAFGPAGVAAGIAIGLVTKGYELLTDKIKSARFEREFLGSVEAEARKSILEEANKVTVLAKIAEDETRTKKDRLSAIKELQEIAPDYFKNLDLESAKKGEITIKSKQYVEQLRNEARVKAINNKLAEEQGKLIDIEEEFDRKLENIQERRRKLKPGEVSYNPITGATDLTAALDNEEEQILRALEKRKKPIQDRIAFIEAELEKAYTPKDPKVEFQAVEFDRDSLESVRAAIKEVNEIIGRRFTDKDVEENLKKYQNQLTKLQKIEADLLKKAEKERGKQLIINETTIEGITNKISKYSQELNKTKIGSERFKELEGEITRLNKLLDTIRKKDDALGIIPALEQSIQDLKRLQQQAQSVDAIVEIEAKIIDKEKALKDIVDYRDELVRRLRDPEAIAREVNPLQPLEDALTLGLGRKGKEFFDEFNKSVIDPLKFSEQTIQGLTNKISFLQNSLLTIPKGTKNFKIVQEEIARLQKLLDETRLIDPPTIEDEAKKALQVYAELSRDILRQDIERTDRQIELQRERVSEFQKIAENGNAEQLQLEEERLKELLEKRERYAQRERAISALLVAAANAEAIANGITAVTKGFVGEGAPWTGIANAIALAATIGSTIVALRNATSSIPAFAEGTEYVHRNGAPKGKDTIFARLNEGERVLTTEQNAKLKGISNSKLVEIASEYQLNNMRMKNIWTAGKREDNTDLIRGINKTNKLLEGLNLYADVNEYGLQMGISRAERSMNRRRNLAR